MPTPLALDAGVLRLVVLHGRGFLNDLESLAVDREARSAAPKGTEEPSEDAPEEGVEEGASESSALLAIDPEDALLDFFRDIDLNPSPPTPAPAPAPPAPTPAPTRHPADIHAIVGSDDPFYPLYRSSFHRDLTFAEYLDIPGLPEPPDGEIFFRDPSPRNIGGKAEPQLALYGRSGNLNSSNTIYNQTVTQTRFFELVSLLQTDFRGKPFTRNEFLEAAQQKLAPKVRRRRRGQTAPAPIQGHYPPAVLRFLKYTDVLKNLPSRGEIFFDCDVVTGAMLAWSSLLVLTPDSRIHARRILRVMREKKRVFGTNGPTLPPVTPSAP
jgi:hypothetical protein